MYSRNHWKCTSALASLLSLVSTCGYSASLPIHGHFVAGQGSINKAGQTLTVKQASTTGIIDWKAFSVGKHMGVTFDNGAGATLNRVTSGNLSTIAGSLHATGSLYLLNSSGVIVSATGKVVTGGSFVASSGALSNSAFDDRNRRFGIASAAIVNRGSVASDGEVKLVGRDVANTGTIAGSHIRLRAVRGDVLAAGTITAKGGAHHDAHILVIANDGETKIDGALIARNRDGSGGSIETSGASLSIGGSIDTGKSGTWLVDPKNLTVGAKAAKTIVESLNAGTSVTLKTTKDDATGPGTLSNGSGNITIAAALTWKSTATLTLDSYHSLLVDAPVRVTGDGRLALLTDDNGGKGGVLAFDKGSVFFANTKDILGINRQAFTLVNNIATLAADIAKHPDGAYALANNYNATADGTYSRSPISVGFTGRFKGLGNTISHLAIRDKNAKDPVGLFASVLAHASVDDLILSDAAIVGNTSVGALAGSNAGLLQGDAVGGKLEGDTYVGGMVGSNSGSVVTSTSAMKVIDNAGTGLPADKGSLVGDLVGYNLENGSVTDSSATGDITASKSSDVGGLVGRNAGIINGSRATGSIHGFNATGGLIGNNEATIKGDSSASGNVYGIRYVGGLAGWEKYGVIDDAHATGRVTAEGEGRDEGGLVGYFGAQGKITKSYASGIVAGNEIAGGLVGLGEGSITLSFATGDVTGTNELGGLIGRNSGAIDQSYATGSVGGTEYLGGFVGENVGGTISQAYATGGVTGSADVGGFAGVNKTSNSSVAEIEQSYSIGAVTAKKNVGGFLGENGGVLSSVDWDKKTSGTSTGTGLDQSGAKGKPTGRTTAQLRSALPGGFKSSVWAIKTKTNGGLPYLVALVSSY